MAAPRWTSVADRMDTVVPGLPAAERVTDFYNLAIENGVIHLHVAPTDNASRSTIERLGQRLPALALAANALPYPRTLRMHDTPLLCAERQWENSSSFFVRPYHLSNICHLYNENLLPLVETTRGAPYERRKLYTFASTMPSGRQASLEHWPLVTRALAAATLDAAVLLEPRRRSGRGGARRCLSHLAWGLGVKPFYSSFRVDAVRRTVERLRELPLRPHGLLPAAAMTAEAAPRGTTLLLRRRGRSQRSLQARSVAALSRELAIDGSLDFGQPVREQLRALAQARLRSRLASPLSSLRPRRGGDGSRGGSALSPSTSPLPRP